MASSLSKAEKERIFYRQHGHLVLFRYIVATSREPLCRAIITLSQVSQTWRHVVSAEKELYKHIIFDRRLPTAGWCEHVRARLANRNIQCEFRIIFDGALKDEDLVTLRGILGVITYILGDNQRNRIKPVVQFIAPIQMLHLMSLRPTVYSDIRVYYVHVKTTMDTNIGYNLVAILDMFKEVEAVETQGGRPFIQGEIKHPVLSTFFRVINTSSLIDQLANLEHLTVLSIREFTDHTTVSRVLRLPFLEDLELGGETDMASVQLIAPSLRHYTAFETSHRMFTLSDDYPNLYDVTITCYEPRILSILASVGSHVTLLTIRGALTALYDPTTILLTDPIFPFLERLSVCVGLGISEMDFQGILVHRCLRPMAGVVRLKRFEINIEAGYTIRSKVWETTLVNGLLHGVSSGRDHGILWYWST